ncbi:hypothetical protein ZWY2020_029313 [Hordeum vulgare]|nr:hypothetical protein ZWY2020_029313 [Hordeum vulgare]
MHERRWHCLAPWWRRREVWQDRCVGDGSGEIPRKEMGQGKRGIFWNVGIGLSQPAKLELLGNATKLYQLISETKKHQAGLLAEEMHMWALSAG